METKPKEVAVKSDEKRASMPNARECALLIAHLLDKRSATKDVSRARLAELTIKKIFNRKSFDQSFVNEVRDWLLLSGWVLFFAGTTYAVVKINVVEGWGRISSKHIQPNLARVSVGQFSFDTLEHLLVSAEVDESAEEAAQDDE